MGSFVRRVEVSLFYCFKSVGIKERVVAVNLRKMFAGLTGFSTTETFGGWLKSNGSCRIVIKCYHCSRPCCINNLTALKLKTFLFTEISKNMGRFCFL